MFKSIVVALVVAVSVVGQQDVSGYKNLTWGMSHQTVCDSVQNEVPCEVEKYCGSYCDIESHINLGVTDWTIDYLFSDSDSTLKQINIVALIANSTAYNTALEQLTIKYGTPTTDIGNEKQWVFKSTTIALTPIPICNRIVISYNATKPVSDL